jgi:type I restriction enzyme R subunit
MNEADTRAGHIDPALKTAGWGAVEGSRVLREHPINLGRLEGVGGRRGKALAADYVLVYRNRKLAVVEAKAWDEPPTAGVAQAKNYADKLAVRFAYSTNGQGLYGIDMKTGAEGEAAYPMPQELWDKTFPEPSPWRDRFAAIPFPDKSGTWAIRFYQEIAVNRGLERIAAGADRALLTLATGTGKTSIALQVAWKLFAAGWNLQDWRAGEEPSRRPRVLFLADRNALATSATRNGTATRWSRSRAPAAAPARASASARSRRSRSPARSAANSPANAPRSRAPCAARRRAPAGGAGAGSR